MLDTCWHISWIGILDRMKIITLDRKIYLGKLKIYYKRRINLQIYERKHICEFKNEIQTVRL
jgi:hypothetical protein